MRLGLGMDRQRRDHETRYPVAMVCKPVVEALMGQTRCQNMVVVI